MKRLYSGMGGGDTTTTTTTTTTVEMHCIYY